MSEIKQVAGASSLNLEPEEDKRPSVITTAPPPHLRLGFFTTACLVANRMIGQLLTYLPWFHHGLADLLERQ